VTWLRSGAVEGHFHCPGAWSFGLHAYAGREDDDLVLWLPSAKAIVTGDSLSDFGDGPDIQPGGRKHVTRATMSSKGSVRCSGLLVELVLPAHGEPTDRVALEQCFPEQRPARPRGEASFASVGRAGSSPTERRADVRSVRDARPPLRPGCPLARVYISETSCRTRCAGAAPVTA
jgi:hypothetical protein